MHTNGFDQNYLPPTTPQVAPIIETTGTPDAMKGKGSGTPPHNKKKKCDPKDQETKPVPSQNPDGTLNTDGSEPCYDKKGNLTQSPTRPKHTTGSIIDLTP